MKNKLTDQELKLNEEIKLSILEKATTFPSINRQILFPPTPSQLGEAEKIIDRSFIKLTTTNCFVDTCTRDGFASILNDDIEEEKDDFINEK